MLQPVQYPHQRLHHHPPFQQQQHHHHHLLPPHQHPLHHDVYAPQPVYHHSPLLLAPTYRRVQIPLQQQTSAVVAPEQQLALAQQHATPTFASQASAPDPGLHLHHQSHRTYNHPQQSVYSHPRARQQQSTMAAPPSDEEMAEMQRLSAAYESEPTVC